MTRFHDQDQIMRFADFLGELSRRMSGKRKADFRSSFGRIGRVTLKGGEAG